MESVGGLPRNKTCPSRRSSNDGRVGTAVVFRGQFLQFSASNKWFWCGLGDDEGEGAEAETDDEDEDEDDGGDKEPGRQESDGAGEDELVVGEDGNGRVGVDEGGNGFVLFARISLGAPVAWYFEDDAIIETVFELCQNDVLASRQGGTRINCWMTCVTG